MFTNIIQICPYCNKDSVIIDVKEGRIVCTTCGYVIKERIIDESYEVRNFNNDNTTNRDQRRVGAAINSIDVNNMNLVIVDTNHGSLLNKIKDKNNIGTYNICQKRIKEIKKIGEIIGAQNNVINSTIKLMNNIEEMKNIKGKDMKCAIIALFYIAFKNEYQPIKIDKMIELTVLQKGRNKIKAYLFEINKYMLSNGIDKVDNRDIIKNSINNFFLIKDNINDIKNIDKFLEIAKEISLVIYPFYEGNNPYTITGLSLLIAREILNEKINTRKIYEYTITKETINKNYNKIYYHLDQILPDKYKDKCKTFPRTFN